ncbi:MAG: hypothetical protein OXF99_05690 [bacterium]|nr:hypothetical protein [bacterium]
MTAPRRPAARRQGAVDRTLPAPPRHPPGGPGRGGRWRRGLRIALVLLRGLARVLLVLLGGLARLVLGVLEWLAGVVAEVVGAILGGGDSGERPVYGYSLRSWDGQTRYVGITNSPDRRETQHHRDGKSGRLVVETKGMSRQQARRWETGRLADHRHRGRNPRYNKTDTGGRWG